MDKQLLQTLSEFKSRASKATFASGNGKVKPWRTGFQELEYREDDWYYRDSYAGFLRSWGQEVIWYKDTPVWTCLYGGGMEAERMNDELAGQTFEFLKLALLAGEKENGFQPRGPASFHDGAWTYHCKLNGDIKKFSGNESISQNNTVVFTHAFAGGLIIDKETQRIG